MKVLYRFSWDCGTMGTLSGLFVADPTAVKAAVGQEVYFGEVLGKHSEISGTLVEADVEELSRDAERIEWLVSVAGSETISGYNPLKHLANEA